MSLPSSPGRRGEHILSEQMARPTKVTQRAAQHRQFVLEMSFSPAIFGQDWRLPVSSPTVPINDHNLSNGRHSTNSSTATLNADPVADVASIDLW
jgi:hypothetical protein